ncbi:MAG: WhiB family transcriptional regulator [Acidimicrobiales bacterium]
MTGWRDAAACAGYATDWWHSDRPADKKDAKDICATCPVTAECLNDADKWGIWGGLDAAERETVTRQQTRLRQDRECKQRLRAAQLSTQFSTT